MRVWQLTLVVGMLLCAACGIGRDRPVDSRYLTVERAAEVDKEVRAFARSVAHDITQEGPSAWRRYFAESPGFFMAADGHLVFPSSASLTSGIPELVQSIRQIKLEWGGDVRVDPLAPDLAVMAAPYREMRTDAAGTRVDETGYFTGVAEMRDGDWQFRDAHWSAAPPVK